MELTSSETQRKSIQISFTNCANKAEAELLKETSDLKSLFILEILLKDKFQRLELDQNQVTSARLQAENTEKEQGEGFHIVKKYRDKYFEIKTEIDQKLMTSAMAAEPSEKRTFKLPKIELKMELHS